MDHHHRPLHDPASWYEPLTRSVHRGWRTIRTCRHGSLQKLCADPHAFTAGQAFLFADFSALQRSGSGLECSFQFGQAFGKDRVASGPLFNAMAVEEGKIRVFFDHVGSGLMVGEKKGLAPTKEVESGALRRFAISGADKKWVWADAVIDGKTVIVSSQKVPNPVAVRYAFSMHPSGCNLYNKEGLPASPFRTDTW